MVSALRRRIFNAALRHQGQASHGSYGAEEYREGRVHINSTGSIAERSMVWRGAVNDGNVRASMLQIVVK